MVAARRPGLGRNPVLDGGEVRPLDGDQATLVGVALHVDDAAAADLVPVDEDEPAGERVVGELVQRQHPGRAQNDLGDAVALDPVGRRGAKIVRVDDPLDRLHLHRGLAGIELQLVFVPHRERSPAEPEKMGAEHVGLDGRAIRVAGHLAALDEDLLVEGDPHRVAGERIFDNAAEVPALDRSDARALVRGREQQLVAHRKPPGLDPSHENATVVEAVDVLQRQSKRQIGRRGRRDEAVEGLDHGRPAMPCHPRRAVGDVVALAGGDRNDVGGVHADALEVRAALAGDRVEAGGRVIHQVHLVDHHRHLAHPQQVQQIAVAP